MIVTTTNSVDGYNVVEYRGIIAAETIIGANVFKDFMAGIRDFFGGRSSEYEKVLKEARTTALNELQQQAQAVGASAVIGVKFDYETVGAQGGMLMVTALGTAVVIQK